MPRKPDARIEKAKELYLAGLKLIDIAKELGTPESTVRSWKNRYKWDCSVANKKRSGAKEDRQEKEAVADEVKGVIQNTGLNDRQRLFCIYYIRCFNATKAYQKAYGCDYISAMNNGSRMLRNDKVKEAILQMKQEKLNREFFNESDIFQKYLDIAFADITDYLEFGTEEVPVTAMNGSANVADSETGEEKQLTKTVNRVRFKDSTHLDGTILSEVKQGKDGASLKLADRMKALQWLSDHMNLATEEQKARLSKLEAETQRIRYDSGVENEDDGVEIINDVQEKEAGAYFRNHNTEIPEDIQQ